jgi:hypothetical protein
VRLPRFQAKLGTARAELCVGQAGNPADAFPAVDQSFEQPQALEIGRAVSATPGGRPRNVDCIVALLPGPERVHADPGLAGCRLNAEASSARISHQIMSTRQEIGDKPKIFALTHPFGQCRRTSSQRHLDDT